MVDDRLEPEGAPGGSTGHRVAELLRENAASATGMSAAKSANRDLKLNSATMGRQVEEPPLIAAVDPRRSLTAVRARAAGGATSGGDDDPIWPDLDAIDQQAGGRQGLKALTYHRQAP
jgi:hypothetical protein